MKINIDKNNVILEGSDLLFEQEKGIYTNCYMKYIATEKGLVLIDRTISCNDDEIERYEEDYINTQELGKKFVKDEKVTLNKLRYPDSPDILYVEEPSSIIEEKNSNNNWWLNHWNNYYALRYEDKDGNIDYYTYDMVHERFIEKIKD